MERKKGGRHRKRRKSKTNKITLCFFFLLSSFRMSVDYFCFVAVLKSLKQIPYKIISVKFCSDALNWMFWLRFLSQKFLSVLYFSHYFLIKCDWTKINDKNIYKLQKVFKYVDLLITIKKYHNQKVLKARSINNHKTHVIKKQFLMTLSIILTAL